MWVIRFLVLLVQNTWGFSSNRSDLSHTQAREAAKEAAKTVVHANRLSRWKTQAREWRRQYHMHQNTIPLLLKRVRSVDPKFVSMCSQLNKTRRKDQRLKSSPWPIGQWSYITLPEIYDLTFNYSPQSHSFTTAVPIKAQFTAFRFVLGSYDPDIRFSIEKCKIYWKL